MLDLAALHYISSEIIIAIAVLVLVLIGSFLNNRISYKIYPFIAIIALVLCVFLSWKSYDSSKVIILNGLFVAFKYTSFAKIVVLLVSIACILISLGYTKLDQSLKQFEYYVLLLLSVLGMMIMVSSNDLMSLYLGLELLGISLYSLVSFNRKNLISCEAGLKYFILGALASGVLLYGMTLIYGFTGTTNFSSLTLVYAKYSSGAAIPIGVIIGVILVVSGLFFKIAAAPFYMWAPDVYQGASLPVTTFLSTAPKAASVFVLIKLILSNFNIEGNIWQPIVIVVACFSLIVGALGALFQTNIKRLLAYSSISHIGFLLIGLGSYDISGVEASIIYLCIYLSMNLGIFAFIAILQNTLQSPNGENFDLSIFKGLSKTNPIVALSISILLLSMAGIPPLAGFLAKFYVLYSALTDHLYFVAIFAMLAAVVSTFYYLKIIKFMYFDESEIHMSDKLLSVENVVIASFATTFNVILILFPMSFNSIVAGPIRSLFE